MRYTLKDYQAEAVRDVLRNLDRARDSYRRYKALSQFSLSATTGAGKTVMAAAVIESLFFGNDEFDVAGDPGAVVLWFSDDPALNEQSRARIQAAASELDHRLRVVPTTFSEPTFRPGNVYFLNTQKLSKNSRLVKGAPEINGDDALPGLEPRSTSCWTRRTAAWGRAHVNGPPSCSDSSTARAAYPRCRSSLASRPRLSGSRPR